MKVSNFSTLHTKKISDGPGYANLHDNGDHKFYIKTTLFHLIRSFFINS